MGSERKAKRRIYRDPPLMDRCSATIVLRDGSLAQCGRRRREGIYCWQHAKSRAPSAQGGGDEAASAW